MKAFTFFLFFAIVADGISQTTINMKKEGGVYTLPCTVNGLKLRFIFDTGASKVSISLTEALFMLKNDYLSKADIYGSSYAQLANGELAENTEILLREIEISGLILKNVRASVVHELGAPLLLGQTAIQQLGIIQLDGDKLTILPREGYSTQDFKYNKTISYNSDSEIYDHTSSTPHYSSDYSGVQGVKKCADIYDRPNMIFGEKVASACNSTVTVIEKISEEYFKVKCGGIVGYLWIGSFENR